VTDRPAGFGVPGRRITPRLAARRARILLAIGRPARVVLGLAALAGGILGLWLVISGTWAWGAAMIVVAAGMLLFVSPDVPGHLRKRRPRSAHWLLLRDHAKLAQGRGLRALVATLQRTRSIEGREILAFLASEGDRTMSDILSTLEEYRDPALRPRARRHLRRLHSGWGRELARLLAIQPATPTDVLNGVTLYRFLADRDGLGSIPRDHQRALVEALLSLGGIADARAVVSGWTDRSDLDLRVVADTVNPWAWPDGDLDEWLTIVNRMYVADDVAQLTVGDGAASPFERLAASAAVVPAAGRRISVVVSAYRPSGLRAAVDSILASSWSDLEVIIVDDASGPEYDEVFATVAERDPRVVVIRLTENGGTYRARNRALGVATGEFVTFHDADDWMHPQRLELQVAPLLEDDELIATASRSVRVTRDVRFSTHRSPYAKICEPSLMYRRDDVTRRIGFFDVVRKSGDIEFRRRLQAAYGIDVPIIGEAPLTLQLATSGSLSDDDILRDWISPARLAYARAADLWHARISNGDADPRLPAHGGPRQFFAPPQISERRVEPSRYDVVYVSNWSVIGSRGGSQRSNEEEIRALVGAGKRVAVAHAEAFWFMNVGRWKLSPRIIQLIEEGLVDLVQLDQEVDTDLLVVRYPPVLQFLAARPSAITARRVLIVANQPPYDTDGSSRRYQLDACSQRVFEVFGLWPQWVPQGPIVRDLLERLVAPGELLGEDMPALVDPQEWRVDRPPREGRKPVIGRYSRDIESKWPEERGALLRAYRSGEFDAILMGGPRILRRVVGPPRQWPASWTVLDTGEITPQELLSRVDFFVYFHHSAYREAFGRSIVEAMASGAIVVLPESFRAVFGDAAVYTTPAGVAEVVGRFYADPAASDEQVARALRFVDETSGHRGYVALVERLTAEVVA
jgi:glycosyltransferase involved in cell wall biosynthesis